MAEFASGYLTYVTYGLVLLAFGLVLYGVFYLVLRPLVLWYFKIYTIVSELQENNALLREIRDELRKRNMQAPISTRQPKEDYSKYMPK